MASVCSVWSTAWLCLRGWWCWSVGSSGAAAGCLFGGSVMTKDWVHGVGNSPVCQILLQIVVRTVITSSTPAWTSSAGMLLTPADFQVGLPLVNHSTTNSHWLVNHSITDNIILYSSWQEMKVVVRSHSKARPKIKLYIYSILIVQSYNTHTHTHTHTQTHTHSERETNAHPLTTPVSSNPPTANQLFGHQ